MRREAAAVHDRPVPEAATDLRGIPGKLGLLDAAARGWRTNVPGRMPLLPTGGMPAPHAVRERVEAVTGADLSGVRLHAGPEAAAHAEAVDARAFTIGRDIYIGAGQLGSHDADRLLAHELAHAAQQHGGAGHAQATLRVGGEAEPAEQEADEIAAAAFANTPTRVAVTRSEPVVRRVRLTGAQAQRVKKVDTDLYFTLASPLTKCAERVDLKATVEPPGLDELAQHANAIDMLLNDLELLTVEDVDPLSKPESSEAIDRSLDALEMPLTKATKLVGTLQNVEHLASNNQLGALAALLDNLATRAHALEQRTVKRALAAEKSEQNRESGQRLTNEAKASFDKHHATAYPAVYGAYGSIDASIEHLAKTGRIAEIADVLTQLFHSRDAKKSESSYHDEFFGLLGGKDKLDKLIAAALHNIAHPETIFQGLKGTCAAAVLEMLIAIQEPTRYIQMICDLASQEGKVGLQDNIKIAARPHPGKDDDSMRNPASQLMQPALMEAMRLGEKYDSKNDTFSNANNNKSASGATDHDLQFGSRLVLERPLEHSTRYTPTDGQPPRPAGLKLRGHKEGHEVLVVHDDGAFVYFINSQLGRPEKMSHAEWNNFEVTLFAPGADANLLAWKQTMLTDENVTWFETTAKGVFQG